MFRSDSIFSRFMNELCDILYVGILWIVCCIPVITMGAATTAAYYTMSKCVRHKSGYIGREFFKAFLNNAKQTTLLTCGALLTAAVIVIDFIYAWNQETREWSAFFMVLCLLTFLFAGIVLYLAPLVSRFHKKNVAFIKLAVILVFRYLPITVVGCLAFLIACAGVLFMPWAVFILPGLYLYALTYPMEYVLKKLMAPVDEESEEAQIWYYQ